MLKDSLKPIREGETFPRPGLELVPEAGELADFLGFERVWVYRWRGGILEGFVRFNTEAEPVTQDLAVSKYIAERVFGKESYEPRAMSGIIMIALKRNGKNDGWGSDCVVRIQFMVQLVDKNGVPQPSSNGTSYTLSGAIDLKKVGQNPPGISGLGSAAGADVYLTAGSPGKDQRKYHFYQLKVSPVLGK